MRTAEDFVEAIADDVGCEADELASVIGMIEADRNATRIALLDELIALDDGSEDTLPVYRAVAMLRAKYTQPVEPGQESE